MSLLDTDVSQVCFWPRPCLAFRPAYPQLTGVSKCQSLLNLFPCPRDSTNVHPPRYLPRLPALGVLLAFCIYFTKIQASGQCFCLFTISYVCSHLSSLAACCALSQAPTICHSSSVPPDVRLLSPLVLRGCQYDESPFPTSISSSSMTQQDSCPLTLL